MCVMLTVFTGQSFIGLQALILQLSVRKVHVPPLNNDISLFPPQGFNCEYASLLSIYIGGWFSHYRQQTSLGSKSRVYSMLGILLAINIFMKRPGVAV